MSTPNKYSPEELKLLEDVGWDRMFERLEQEMPQRRRRRFGLWWWYVPAVVGIGVAGSWFMLRNGRPTEAARTAQTTPNTEIKAQISTETSAQNRTFNNGGSATTPSGNISAPSVAPADSGNTEQSSKKGSNTPTRAQTSENIVPTSGQTPTAKPTFADAPTAPNDTKATGTTAPELVIENHQGAQVETANTAYALVLPLPSLVGKDAEKLPIPPPTAATHSADIKVKRTRMWQISAEIGVKSSHFSTWGGYFAGIGIERNITPRLSLHSGLSIGHQMTDATKFLKNQPVHNAVSYGYLDSAVSSTTPMTGKGIVINFDTQNVYAGDVIEQNASPFLVNFSNEANQTTYVVCDAGIMMPHRFRSLYVGIPLRASYRLLPRLDIEAGLSGYMVVPYNFSTASLLENTLQDSPSNYVPSLSARSWQLSGSAGFRYRFTHHLSLRAGYEHGLHNISTGQLHWRLPYHSLTGSIVYGF